MDKKRIYDSNNHLKEVWEAFEKSVKGADSHKSFTKVLETVLTSGELALIEKRLAIKFLLNQKTAIKQISKIVGVNRGTIRFIRDDFKRKRYKKLPKGMGSQNDVKGAAKNYPLVRYRFTHTKKR